MRVAESLGAASLGGSKEPTRTRLPAAQPVDMPEL